MATKKKSQNKSRSKHPTLDKFDNIRESREQIDFREGELLKSLGWTYTSQTPGSLWMWMKKLPNGHIYLVIATTATYIERELSGEEYQDEGD